MNYYLKYRPQKISELDLAAVREALTQALSGKSFPHAWLLAGPKGTGKTSSARIVAKSVNCLNRKGSPEPCGRCESCRQITAGTALDVLEIDAASNRGIDNIRELKERINLAPAGLSYKVYIIDEVHMLTKEAFNALLKTLEEPPPHAVFILATTEPEKLPATVVSRCLTVFFAKAGREELLRSLQRVAKAEKLKPGKELLARIIAVSEGSFRDAVKLLEHPVNLDRLDLDDWLGLVYRGEVQTAINWLQRAWESGSQPKLVLLRSIERLRQCLLFQLGAGGEALAGVDDPDRLKRLLERLAGAAAGLKDSLTEALPLELAVVDWCRTAGQTAPPVRPETKPAAKNQSLAAAWPEVLAAVKPLNHSLEALLKAAEPLALDEGTLEVRVYYRFHKEKLEEERYRQMVEQAAGRILGRPVKIRYFLGSKETDIIKSTQEVFGIEVN